MAPISRACVPSHTRWLLRRVSSVSITRIHCACGGNLQPEQFLHRQAVAQVVGKRRQVIHAVGEGDRLLVVLDLELLLDAGVQVADIGLALDHGFAVELEHQAQHAVRGRVLRPHVEDHAARTGSRLFFGRVGRDAGRQGDIAHG